MREEGGEGGRGSLKNISSAVEEFKTSLGLNVDSLTEMKFYLCWCNCLAWSVLVIFKCPQGDWEPPSLSSKVAIIPVRVVLGPVTHPQSVFSRQFSPHSLVVLSVRSHTYRFLEHIARQDGFVCAIVTMKIA